MSVGYVLYMHRSADPPPRLHAARAEALDPSSMAKGLPARFRRFF
jgi:hypothetical protein